jgi:hypothetical protein
LRPQHLLDCLETSNNASDLEISFHTLKEKKTLDFFQCCIYPQHRCLVEERRNSDDTIQCKVCFCVYTNTIVLFDLNFCAEYWTHLHIQVRKVHSVPEFKDLCHTSFETCWEALNVFPPPPPSGPLQPLFYNHNKLAPAFCLTLPHSTYHTETYLTSPT